MSINHNSLDIRSPRLRVEINGVNINSIMQADIMAAGSRRTSKFELTASVNDFSKRDSWLNTLSGRVSAEIFMRLQPSDDEESMFEGLVDAVSFDPIQKVARVRGTDYSSLLSSSAYQESFCNRTSGEIAAAIASRHGFDTNIVSTFTLVGSYRYDGYNKMLLNAHTDIISEWELLKHLAKIEGFETFVQGKVLFFTPASLLPRNNISLDTSKVMKISLHKNCPLYEQTSLTVKSWNSWLGQTSSYTNGSSVNAAIPDAITVADNTEMQIAIIKPNLTDENAQNMALRYTDTLNRQVLSVDVVMPGETMMNPYDVLTVSTGATEFDSDYIVSSIRRHFSATAGFSQHVQGYATGAAPANSQDTALQ